MKRLVTIFFICLAIAVQAQIKPDPAHWAYGLKKINNNLYEVHLRCTVDEGWHIYAQNQSRDFIGTRTKVTFNKVPGVELIGIPAEFGKKDIFKNIQVGITNFEYAGTVDFVQKVKLKPAVKALKGTITYQTCTHKECLAEKTIDFTIPVKE